MSQNNPITSILNTTDYNNQFKQFILNNNIIGTTAGVVAGICIKDVILSFIGDVLIPLITLGLIRLNIDWLTKYLPDGNTFDITNFIKEFTTFIICLYVGFILIKFTFEQILGVKKGVNGQSYQNAQSIQQQPLPQQYAQQPPPPQAQQYAQQSSPQVQQYAQQPPMAPQYAQQPHVQNSPFTSTYSSF